MRRATTAAARERGGRGRREHLLGVKEEDLSTYTGHPPPPPPEVTLTRNPQPLCGTTTGVSGERESVPIRTIWQRSLYGAGEAAQGKVGNALILWSTEASAGPHGPETSLHGPAVEEEEEEVRNIRCASQALLCHHLIERRKKKC